ncbi:MAG: cytochrome c-type biogenesis protein CcmH [Gammaproteobacteria bacterium]|nr:cytochrome c-type biogenesis protein CcmH [Gammaproteobacteria bacterium]
MKRGATLIACLAAAGFAWAVDTTPPLPTPELQQRYLEMTRELRCVQCQNEAIADSPVSLAADLRRQVRGMIMAGQSDEQIRAYMVDRYGEFILFRPRLNWRTVWLWSAPAVLLLAGVVAGLRVLARRTRLAAGDTAPLEDEAPDR